MIGGWTDSFEVPGWKKASVLKKKAPHLRRGKRSSASLYLMPRATPRQSDSDKHAEDQREMADVARALGKTEAFAQLPTLEA